MTSKRDYLLPVRTPAYVSAEVGAAELCISVTTWNSWVRDGVLPPPTRWLGRSGSSPRWRWKDIDAYLSGRELPDEKLAPKTEPLPEIKEPFFRELPDGTSQKRKSPSARKRSLHHQTERAKILLLPAKAEPERCR